jgi:hypothetical protein
MGCTDCGRKGGCDSRKHGMFAAVDEAMARLYPTRRWGERDETVALGEGITSDEGGALAGEIASRLGTMALFHPGDPHEWCDYIYVLCLGRTPSVVEIRDGRVPPPVAVGDGSVGHAGQYVDNGGDGHSSDAQTGDIDDAEDVGPDGLDERYLRVALSGLARFAGVQEVAMTLRRQGDDLVITERARGGVFDPILLPRFQALVAVLIDRDIRHLDFGEIVEPPSDFDPSSYADFYGGEPVIANYLFYPQPPTAVSTVVVASARDGGGRAIG